MVVLCRAKEDLVVEGQVAGALVLGVAATAGQEEMMTAHKKQPQDVSIHRAGKKQGTKVSVLLCAVIFA